MLSVLSLLVILKEAKEKGNLKVLLDEKVCTFFVIDHYRKYIIYCLHFFYQCNETQKQKGTHNQSSEARSLKSSPHFRRESSLCK